MPRLPVGQAASAGPAKDCGVDKISEFETELVSKDVSADEQILALKFVVRILGDLHQPLHSADHQDEGGNCIALEPTAAGSKNLRAYWDTGVMKALGDTPEAIADKLDAETTAAQRSVWSKGTPKQWAMQAFALARRDAYALPLRPTCAAKGSVSLSDAYQAQAQKDVDLQLRRAGVPIATTLNRAFR